MRSDSTIVFGASGHGKVVCDILRACGIEVHGFIDSNEDLQGTRVMDLPVLGSDEWIVEKLKTGSVSVALGIGRQHDRKLVAERLRTLGARILTAIHPRAVVAASAKLGEGTVIMAGALINADARVGMGVIINTGSIVEHDVVLGDYSHLSPGAVTGGAARVGALSHVGLGAIVLPRVSVGSNCIVGAGAVVLKDIPDNVVAYGVPAEVQRSVTRANYQRA